MLELLQQVELQETDVFMVSVLVLVLFCSLSEVWNCFFLPQQCSSTEVTCESGAVMAASLANGGLCPLSGDQVLSPASVRSMMSMMQVAGMKESSTAFLHKVHTSKIKEITPQGHSAPCGFWGLVAAK